MSKKTTKDVPIDHKEMSTFLYQLVNDWGSFCYENYILDFLNILLIDIFLLFSGKVQFNVLEAILTGITFVEFIDFTNIVMVKDFNGDLDIIDQPNGIAL